MKKTILLLASLFLHQITDAQTIINVNQNIQEQDQWCWSASSKTILEQYGTNLQQCEIAEWARTQITWHDFGSTNCCTDASKGCNYWNYSWGYNGSIVDILSHWGQATSTLSSSLTFAQVQTEINAGRPFILRWGWSTSGGHFLVGHGYNATNQTLYIMNPWFGEGKSIQTYNWVYSAVGPQTSATHTWTHTVLMKNGVTGSNQIPVVNLTSPSNNQAFASSPNSISINATASDADGTISKVEFYNGSTLLGTDNTSPYTFTWTNVADGNYSITAKAYDNLNAIGTSSAIIVKIGNQAPIVNITSPTNNAGFSPIANIAITANASDIDGTVKKVEFYNGSTLLGTDTLSPFSYNWANVAAGNYSITAKAYDNKNISSTSSIINISVSSGCSVTAWSSSTTYTAGMQASYNNHTYTANYWAQGTSNAPGVISSQWTDNGLCTVASTAPTISITSQGGNTTYIAPANIIITATSNINSSNIKKIEFYINDVLMNIDSISPFTYDWSISKSGNYNAKAIIYDKVGNFATSNNINFTISPVTGITVFQENNLNIYPNPNQGSFLINTDKNVSISVCNLLGEKLKTLEILQGINYVELNLLKGMYFLNSENKTYKLIIE